MRVDCSKLLPLLAGALFLPGLALAAPETFTLDDPRGPAPTVRAGKPGAEVSPSPSAELGVMWATLPAVVLAAPDARRIAEEDEARAALSSDKVLRYGVGRPLAVAERDGVWTPVPAGGRLWALEVGSSGALALRLRFSSLRLPEGARLAVVGVGTRAETYELPATGAQAWTPSVLGDRVRVEYFEPAGAPRAALPFRLDRLQHIYLDPLSATSGIKPLAAGACENDVTCHPDWKREARAVAGLGVIGEDSLFCTGQLLNDQAQDLTPYFLTANHCAGDPSVAPTAEFYWFYQTAVCDGDPPTLASVPHSNGATLLSAGSGSDYALLLVDGHIPDGVAWAGWTANAVPDFTDAAVIHHPSGDFKRISFGFKRPELECGGAQHLRIKWTDGPTEDGSSGSGAFRADTHQLFAQLHCGPSECGRETYDQFGAFVATYPHIAALLAAGADDNSEPDDTCATARLIPTGTYNGRVVKYGSPDWYRVRVPPGKTLRVTFHFTRQNGVLAAQLLTGCGQPAKAVATGAHGTRTLQFVNPGPLPSVRFGVTLPDDVRLVYSMTVEIL
jgi:hypothetical protein